MSVLEENENCWLYNCCSHVDCDKPCIKRIKLDYLYNAGLITEKQRIRFKFYPDKRDADTFKYLSNISKNILKFVDKGGNLYIHSKQCGNGKTSLALRLIQSYLDKIWATSPLECRVLFINVPRYLLEIKNNISEKSDYIEHISKNVLNADLVVWDDIGTKGLTQFEHENVLSMINARLDAGKANIYTSNLSKEELHESVGDRLYSRVYSLSDDVELFGDDYRPNV